MESMGPILPTLPTIYKKINNTYYKMFNTKELSREEMLKFILEAMNNEASRVLAMLTVQYPEVVEEFEIRKQGGTPDYLKLNNPIEEVREMITINIEKLQQTKMPDAKLEEIVIAIINATTIKEVTAPISMYPSIPTSDEANKVDVEEIKKLMEELKVMRASMAEQQKAEAVTAPTTVNRDIALDPVESIEDIVYSEIAEPTEPTEPTIEEMKEEMIEAALEMDATINIESDNEIEGA